MTTDKRRSSAERRVAGAEQMLMGAQRKLGALPSAPRTGQEHVAVTAARMAIREAEAQLTKARRALRETAVADAV